ncbi:phospholipase D-like domain-containing protein [Catenulispora pinisilvae]|uniref:phospholipase D-like domain-containing protein n=2 Tax=Catenulispora TaxID=414878 RepID=UPI001892272D|nr:phospholipase D-like domain-containing protein [Catenulispora pinisilvae]
MSALCILTLAFLELAAGPQVRAASAPAGTALTGTAPAGTAPAVPTATAPAVPPGTYLYVGNSGDNTLSVVNTANPTAAVPGSPIAVGAPEAVAVTPDGTKAYVVGNNGSISVVDTASDTLTSSLLSGPGHLGIAMAVDGRHAYITNSRADTVSVLDTSTDTITGTIPVGHNPYGVAAAPDGRHLYVTDNVSNSVSVIDTETNAVTDTIAVGVAPIGVAVTPDGSKVYVPDATSGTVSVIATAGAKKNEVVATVPVGTQPFGVAITPDGSHAYVENFGGNTVSVIATAGDTVSSTVTVQTHPYAAVASPDGSRVYVGNSNSDSVSAIDTATGAVSSFPVGVHPGGLAIGRVVTKAKTPYLDAVQAQLRQSSPGLEHTVWERTDGNALDPADPADPTSWILDVPGCFDKNPCKDRPGMTRFLGKIVANLSAAKHTIDISALGLPEFPGSLRFGIVPGIAFPDGDYYKSIVQGAHNALANQPAGGHLQVRFLMGAGYLPFSGDAPGYATKFVKDVTAGLSAGYAQRLWVNVAEMTTSAAVTIKIYTGPHTVVLPTINGATPSWNHSKLYVVDGHTALTGGINPFSQQYIDTPKPVTDMMIALKGPAASSAGKFLNRMWQWVCAQPKARSGDMQGVWIGANSGAGCLQHFPATDTATPGNEPVLSVASLGVGVQADDQASTFQLPAITDVQQANCLALTGSFKDLINNGKWATGTEARDFYTVNPDLVAQHALIEAAKSSIILSQQDVFGGCYGKLPFYRLPYMDLQLFDDLARKMAQGVKVRIVVSTPRQPDDYSVLDSLGQEEEGLRQRIMVVTGMDESQATQLMHRTLQLASLRTSEGSTWEGKQNGITCKQGSDSCTYALHTKLVMVDDKAFYIGSRNLYSAMEQDHGYIIEDAAAAQQLHQKFLDPEWKFSKDTAIVDWTTASGTWPRVDSVIQLWAPDADQPTVEVGATTQKGGAYTVEWGDGTSSDGESGQVASHLYSEGFGSYVITLHDKTTGDFSTQTVILTKQGCTFCTGNDPH